MDYFDLHCDTATEIYKKHLSLDENNLNVSLKKVKKYQRWAQVFAVWIDDGLRGDKAWRYFCDVRDYFMTEVNSGGALEFCRCAADLKDAAETKKNAALLSIEGGAALGGKEENIYGAYEKGVRLITLTWNGRCETGDGCMEPDAGGLTQFGLQTVREMNRLNMIVDVSHLSEAGFWDVARAAQKPFAATHSDSKAICPNKRNLTDEQFKEIARGGGVVGINLHRAFLSGDTAGIEDVLRHAEHFLELGGEKTLAVGADFDGCDLPKEIGGAEDMDKIYNAMCARFGESTAQNIFYSNAYNFFIKNLS